MADYPFPAALPSFDPWQSRINRVAFAQNDKRRSRRRTAGSRSLGWLLADDRVKQVKEANDIVEVVGEYLSLRRVGRGL